MVRTLFGALAFSFIIGVGMANPAFAIQTGACYCHDTQSNAYKWDVDDAGDDYTYAGDMTLSECHSKCVSHSAAHSDVMYDSVLDVDKLRRSGVYSVPQKSFADFPRVR